MRGPVDAREALEVGLRGEQPEGCSRGHQLRVVPVVVPVDGDATDVRVLDDLPDGLAKALAQVSPR